MKVGFIIDPDAMTVERHWFHDRLSIRVAQMKAWLKCDCLDHVPDIDNNKNVLYCGDEAYYGHTHWFALQLDCLDTRTRLPYMCHIPGRAIVLGPCDDAGDDGDAVCIDTVRSHITWKTGLMPNPFR